MTVGTLLKRLATAGSVAGLMLFSAGQAQAAACTAGAGGDIYLTIDGTTHYAAACAGPVAFNGNPAEENTLINGQGWGSFTYIAKDAGDQTGTLGGIQFTIDAAIDQVSGDWTLTWMDANGPGNPQDLPILFDFVVLLKSSTEAVMYFFDDVLLPDDPYMGSGQFSVVVQNKNDQFQALSHMSIHGRLTPCSPTDPRCQTQDVPEPGSLLLLGAGLAGLALVRRRRRA